MVANNVMGLGRVMFNRKRSYLDFDLRIGPSPAGRELYRVETGSRQPGEATVLLPAQEMDYVRRKLEDWQGSPVGAGAGGGRSNLALTSLDSTYDRIEL